MRRALGEYYVLGIKTTIPFFQWVLDDEDFVAGRFDTGFIDRKLGARNGRPLARADRRPTRIWRRWPSPWRGSCPPPLRRRPPPPAGGETSGRRAALR